MSRRDKSIHPLRIMGRRVNGDPSPHRLTDQGGLLDYDLCKIGIKDVIRDEVLLNIVRLMHDPFWDPHESPRLHLDVSDPVYPDLGPAI